jgi:uncharacterized membrane protein YjfL (UPF0719 family)
MQLGPLATLKYHRVTDWKNWLEIGMGNIAFALMNNGEYASIGKQMMPLT